MEYKSTWSYVVNQETDLDTFNNELKHDVFAPANDAASIKLAKLVDWWQLVPQ